MIPNSLSSLLLLLQICLQHLALNPAVNLALERLSSQRESFTAPLWISGATADRFGKVHDHLYLARHPNHRFQAQHSSFNFL